MLVLGHSVCPLARTAHSFAWSALLALLARAHALTHSLAHSAHSFTHFAHSFTHLAHCRARGTVNDRMAIYSVFFCYFGPQCDGGIDNKFRSNVMEWAFRAQERLHEGRLASLSPWQSEEPSAQSSFSKVGLVNTQQELRQKDNSEEKRGTEISQYSLIQP